MSEHQRAYARYLPPSPESVQWGLSVMDGGFSEASSNLANECEHPKKYAQDEKTGRVLDEYQIAYTTKGSGTFESKPTGKKRIRDGFVFILFPGEWHRYQCTASTGWDQHWVGFNGSYADQLMGKPFYSPKKAVLDIGVHEPLLNCFIEISNLMQAEPFGYRNIIAAKTVEIIARIHARSQGPKVRSPENEDMVRQARVHMLQHSDMPLEPEQMARDFGRSYSSFRRIFKQHTGLGPVQYHLQLRLSKAESLLRGSTMPVTEIAEKTGFDSLYYFSRCFKSKSGLAPSDYRKKSLGEA